MIKTKIFSLSIDLIEKNLIVQLKKMLWTKKFTIEK